VTDLSTRGISDLPSPRDEATLYRLAALSRTGAPAAPAQTTRGSRVIQLDARFESGGVWAGVGPLMEMAYLELLEIGQDAIVEQHDYELYKALPGYRDKIHPRYQCLTDTAIDGERTRFYALDRAHRVISGLVGMILQWRQALSERDRWTVIVRNFDQAQHLTTRFFAELARRCAPSAEIAIIIETRAGRPDAELRPLGVQALPAAQWIIEVEPERATPSTLAESEIRHLEQQLEAGAEAPLELHYPALLAHYRAAGDGMAAARLALKMLKIYNRDAYYFESKTFLDIILPYFNQLVGTDQRARISAVSEMNKCLITTGDQARVPQLVEELATPYLTEPAPLATMNYILSMHYLRYAEPIDMALAERHILRAVEAIRAAKDDPSAHDYPFIKVFIDNGLALLRARQGRHQEALDLCRSGYESLSANLGENRHLLHRSVLIYNVGQVYVMLGRLEEGLEFYRKAMAMDPYFPEYYNDFGNVLQKLDRYQEAIDYYALGLKYGTPSPVLYFNKAICHSQQEDWEEALHCFEASLEMQPNQPEIYAMRGELLAGLGKVEEALADYDSTLDLAPNSVAARVNRAVLHYSNGSYELALADMDHVIALEAEEPGHYENRAAIYQALNRESLYHRDLSMAERYRESA
jgi:tetratricopeptide (TPR) repeat protein